MNRTLEEFKSFLARNTGKLPLGTLRQTITVLDGYMDVLMHSDGERKEVQRLMEEAFGIDQPTLKFHLERGGADQEKEYIDDFEGLIPPDGLVRDYIEYTRKTESPTAYHFFSFLTVLGAILGRQIWVDQQVYKVWPNMVVLLVGPSGRLRKTTAAEFAMKLGYEDALCDSSGEPRMDVLAEKTTSEAIHSALAGRNPATGLLYAPEMSTVINKKEYNKSLINDLTRLWDCPDVLSVRTQSRGRETLRNVGLSALFCSNEEWLVESIPEDAFKGGFFSRMIQVYVSHPREEIPRPEKLSQKLRDEIIFGLVETTRCTGSAPLTREAERYFDKRYRAIMRSIPNDPRLAPWVSRVPDHMLRLGLLLSISEHRPETIYIEDYHLEQADKILQWVTKYLPKVYSLMGVSEVGEDARRVIHVISKNGGRISRQNMTRQIYGHLTITQLDERLRTLRQAGIIKQVEGGLFDDSHPTMYYVLLKNPEDIQ